MAALPRGLFGILSQPRPEVGPPRGYISGGLPADDTAAGTATGARHLPMGRYGELYRNLPGRAVAEQGSEWEQRAALGTPLLTGAIDWLVGNVPAWHDRRHQHHLAELPYPSDSPAVEARFGDNFCISENGMTTCHFPGLGIVTPPFPQGDLPDRIGSGDDNAHRYVISDESPTMEGLTQGLIDNPTPGAHDRPATPGGTPNDAVPPGDSWKPFSPSPVRSFTFIDPNGGLTYVLNVTDKGHPLYPGVVLRIDRPAGQGHAIIDNVGVGTGVLQAPVDIPVAPDRDHYARAWHPTDEETIARLLEKRKSRQP